MRQIPPPNVHELLLPVIACLPTAFISPKPPPALLPYLSPILRQRLSLLSSSAPTSQEERSAWLPLLTWSSSRASRLQEIVSELQLEPHPVSGEPELFEEDDVEDDGKVQYKRLDSETLQAKCDVRKHRVSVIWTWCTNDTGAGLDKDAEQQGGQLQADGWKVTEVSPIEQELENNDRIQQRWYDSLSEAEEGFPLDTERLNGQGAPHVEVHTEKEEDDDDAAYWASYDRTPGAQTPKRPSNVGAALSRQYLAGQQRATDEDAYFARYGGEVQPAMDGHDPAESETTPSFESTLRHQDDPSFGRQINEVQRGRVSSRDAPIRSARGTELGGQIPDDSDIEPQSGQIIDAQGASHSQPQRESDPLSASSPTAEVGIKQHISTEMKSLYRLARAAGIDRSEFERVIRRELDVLGMMDDT